MRLDAYMCLRDLINGEREDGEYIPRGEDPEDPGMEMDEMERRMNEYVREEKSVSLTGGVAVPLHLWWATIPFKVFYYIFLSLPFSSILTIT
jgi:hypothetical protein